MILRRAAWLFFSAACTAHGADIAQPYVPASDGVVLEHVRAPRVPGVGLLTDLRAAANESPGVLGPAMQYARAAVDVGRREEDPRYFGRAESTLAPWLARPTPPFEVTLLHAQLLVARQDFDGARHDLDRVVDAGVPESAQALLVRALLDLRQGRPAAARDDCTTLAARAPSLATAVCAAAAIAAAGHAGSARQTLLAREAEVDRAPVAVQVFFYATLADTEARLGDDQAAADHFDAASRKSEAAGSRDPGVLAALADCLLESGRERDVIDRLAAFERMDSLLVRLAIAETRRAASDPRMADAAQQHARLLAARFSELRQRDTATHLREEGLFELAVRNDPAKALDLAARNWALQREAVDARLLVRAALAAHDPEAARPVADWVRETGFEDVRLVQLLQDASAPRVAP